VKPFGYWWLLVAGHGGPPGRPFGYCWLFSLIFFFLRKILVCHWAWGTAWEALWVLLASKTAGVVFFSPWGGLIVKKNNLFIDILAIYVGRGGA
jgi:hypothetical protein